MQLNFKVIKKVVIPPPHFYISPPTPFQGYPPFLAKSLVPPPQMTQFLEGPRGAGGGFPTKFLSSHL